MAMDFQSLTIIIITGLLPLTAFMLVIQTNPYQALVLRGILGAVAALIYALLGGADVALTEALVGTMLSITLYAVAVRSSLTVCIGLLAGADTQPNWHAWDTQLRSSLTPYHLKLEIQHYDTPLDLQNALTQSQIQAHWLDGQGSEPPQLHCRVPRLLEIWEAHLDPQLGTLIATPTSPNHTPLPQEVHP